MALGREDLGIERKSGPLLDRSAAETNKLGKRFSRVAFQDLGAVEIRLMWQVEEIVDHLGPDKLIVG
jgi:hypothetical protein